MSSTLLLCAYFSFMVFFSVSDFFNFPAFQVVVIKLSSLFPYNLAIFISHSAAFPEYVFAKPLSKACAPFTVHQSWMRLHLLTYTDSAFDFLVPNTLVLLWFPPASLHFPSVLLRSSVRNSWKVNSSPISSQEKWGRAETESSLSRNLCNCGLFKEVSLMPQIENFALYLT